MEKLRIEWDDRSNGFMELNVDKFFPCTADKATKVFKLVARWCSDETIAELKEYLLTEQAEVKKMLDKPLLDEDIKHLQNALQALCSKYQNIGKIHRKEVIEKCHFSKVMS